MVLIYLNAKAYSIVTWLVFLENHNDFSLFISFRGLHEKGRALSWSAGPDLFESWLEGWVFE